MAPSRVAVLPWTSSIARLGARSQLLSGGEFKQSASEAIPRQLQHIKSFRSLDSECYGFGVSTCRVALQVPSRSAEVGARPPRKSRARASIGGPAANRGKLSPLAWHCAVCSSASLATDADQLSPPSLSVPRSSFGSSGRRCSNRFDGADSRYSAGQRRDVLPMLNVLIHRNEHIARRRGPLHQRAVLQASPTVRSDGGDHVQESPLRIQAEDSRHENAHPPVKCRGQHRAPQQPAHALPTETR